MNEEPTLVEREKGRRCILMWAQNAIQKTGHHCTEWCELTDCSRSYISISQWNEASDAIEETRKYCQESIERTIEILCPPTCCAIAVRVEDCPISGKYDMQLRFYDS